MLIKINQGQVSEDDEECILLVLSKDDIRSVINPETFKESGLYEKMVQKVFDLVVKQGTDMLMDDFWSVIDQCIESVKEDQYKYKETNEE